MEGRLVSYQLKVHQRHALRLQVKRLGGPAPCIQSHYPTISTGTQKNNFMGVPVSTNVHLRLLRLYLGIRYPIGRVIYLQNNRLKGLKESDHY